MRFFCWAASGTLFPFVMTALGAALVFLLCGRISPRLYRMSVGFAGGVMSAASVFSLLLPAMEQAGNRAWLVASAGFLLGAAVIGALDMAFASLLRRTDERARRQILMICAVTLHNIPEGMAVGIAFALASQGAPLAAACTLALAIGLQNLPEGAAVALPLRQSGMSRQKSFAVGVFSGAVEPVFGVLAALLAAAVRGMMPGLMAFAAGAMMLVVFSEMIPAAGQRRDGAAAAVAGYVMMMALDLALG